MVMAQSLFMTLKNNNSQCQIDVLAPEWSFPLLDRMPEVTMTHSMSLGHGKFGFNTRLELGKYLRYLQYDQAILLPNSWKSALVPFFAKISLRTGYLGECRWGLLNDSRQLDKKKLTMTVQRFVALGFTENNDSSSLHTYPLPRLLINEEKKRAVIKSFDLQPTEKILALCPGAEFGPSKRWPEEYYAQVAKQKIQQGWQVFIFGSEKDQAVAEKINQQTDYACVDFSGKTTLQQAVDLMSLAHTVVTNDSGLMHVAAALDKKIVALYGSSDPGFTPPLCNQATILNLNLDCSPCFKRECPFFHNNCLTQIKPEVVIEAMD